MTPSFSFADDPRPIGVFDSGVGGLTVLKALMRDLPGQHFIYLGDTARVPYGTKSAETVRGYSLDLARILMRHDVKMIVIACNTASAHAAEAVQAVVPVPVIGMIGAAADATLAVTKGRVLVMATQSTVLAGSYDHMLKSANPALHVRSIPCQVLVALAEEGWDEGAVADAALEQYIGPYFREDASTRPDTVILGCTHFPLLKRAILKCAGPDVALVDTGEAAAQSIVRDHGPFNAMTLTGDVRFYVTDAVERFKRAAQRFLELPPATWSIERIDL